MTTEDIIYKLSEGNPGAISVMCSMIQQYDSKGNEVILLLDYLNIYGSDIWIMFVDKYGRDLDKMISALEDKASKLGYFI